MELDDASIASFATARVFKVIPLLSAGDGKIERTKRGARESTKL